MCLWLCTSDVESSNLRGYHWLFGHKAPGLKDSELFDCCEICLFLASDSQVTLLCVSGHFGNISGLSL